MKLASADLDFEAERRHALSDRRADPLSWVKALARSWEVCIEDQDTQ